MPVIDGIILVNKPAGFTSFDVVAKLRGIFGTRKIGHAGTLDPMAVGVLPVFIGAATKACDCMPVQDKSYRAAMRLGLTTDTLDITGKVLSQNEVNVKKADVERALESFRGEITQVPPMYSAVKIGGKKLYELARAGKTVERPERKVTIYSVELTDCNEAENEYTIDVDCSKGTYIRTLCDDIGACLGCGAVMTALTRTKAAGFSLDMCYTLPELEKMKSEGELERAVIPVERAFESMDAVCMNSHDAYYFCNGLKMNAQRFDCIKYKDRDFAVYEALGQDKRAFLGTAYIDDENNVRIRKLFAKRSQKPV